MRGKILLFPWIMQPGPDFFRVLTMWHATTSMNIFRPQIGKRKHRKWTFVMDRAKKKLPLSRTTAKLYFFSSPGETFFRRMRKNRDVCVHAIIVTPRSGFEERNLSENVIGRISSEVSFFV